MLERLIQINGKTIKVDQVLDNSHAGTVWDGALVIISYFGRQANQIQNIFKNKTILELGAGTGIVGLAITSFQPKRVILTDFKENLKILEHNKHRNHPASQNVQICELHWGDRKSSQAIGQVDVIVGSELAYDATNIKLLVQTLQFFRLANPNLICLISHTIYSKSEKNLTNYLGSIPYQNIPFQDMDPDFRDESIGIIRIG